MKYKHFCNLGNLTFRRSYWPCRNSHYPSWYRLKPPMIVGNFEKRQQEMQNLQVLN